jgi:hypothetical protein
VNKNKRVGKYVPLPWRTEVSEARGQRDTTADGDIENHVPQRLYICEEKCLVGQPR